MLRTLVSNVLKCDIDEEEMPADQQQQIHAHLNEIWRVSPRNKSFVAPSPVSLNRHHLKGLRAENYMVAAKTDGLRVNVLICSLPDPLIIIYGRGRNFIRVRGRVPSTYYRQNGTLLDGELTMDGTLSIFDVVYSKGLCMMNKSYLERMQQVGELIDEKVMTLYGLVVVPKKVYPLKDFESLLASMESDPDTNDGIIFTLVDQHIRHGTEKTTLKYKKKPTVDLLLTRDSTGLAQLQWGTETGLSQISASSKYLSVSTEHMPEELEWAGVHEFEVTCDAKQNRLNLSWFRDRSGEKDTPNFHKTVLATFDEVEENITLGEISQILSHVKIAPLQATQVAVIKQVSKPAAEIVSKPVLEPSACKAKKAPGVSNVKTVTKQAATEKTTSWRAIFPPFEPYRGAKSDKSEVSSEGRISKALPSTGPTLAELASSHEQQQQRTSKKKKYRKL